MSAHEGAREWVRLFVKAALTKEHKRAESVDLPTEEQRILIRHRIEAIAEYLREQLADPAPVAESAHDEQRAVLEAQEIVGYVVEHESVGVWVVPASSNYVALLAKDYGARITPLVRYVAPEPEPDDGIIRGEDAERIAHEIQHGTPNTPKRRVTMARADAVFARAGLAAHLRGEAAEPRVAPEPAAEPREPDADAEMVEFLSTVLNVAYNRYTHHTDAEAEKYEAAERWVRAAAARLRAEAAEPQPDTARLDWLQSNEGCEITRMGTSVAYWLVQAQRGDGHGDTLREAIDDARAAQHPQGDAPAFPPVRKESIKPGGQRYYHCKVPGCSLAIVHDHRAARPQGEPQ